MLIAGTHGTGWLFAGRLIVGLGSGSAFSTGAAWIRELSAPLYEDLAPGAGARRVSGSMTLGFALGPLVAGAPAQCSPRGHRKRYGPARRASMMPGGGGCTGSAIPGSFSWCCRWRPVFISCSVGFVYVPGLVAGHASSTPIAFAAAAALAVAAGGVAVQPLARRLAGRDRPGRPWSVVTGLALVFGLTEVARLASPRDLAGLTGVFQVAC